jgi:hypothetical protein
MSFQLLRGQDSYKVFGGPFSVKKHWNRSEESNLGPKCGKLGLLPLNYYDFVGLG